MFKQISLMILWLKCDIDYSYQKMILEMFQDFTNKIIISNAHIARYARWVKRFGKFEIVSQSAKIKRFDELIREIEPYLPSLLLCQNKHCQVATCQCVLKAIASLSWWNKTFLALNLPLGIREYCHLVHQHKAKKKTFMVMVMLAEKLEKRGEEEKGEWLIG